MSTDLSDVFPGITGRIFINGDNNFINKNGRFRMNDMPKMYGMSRLILQFFPFKYEVRYFNCFLTAEPDNTDCTYARSSGDGNNGIVERSVDSCQLLFINYYFWFDC